MRFNVLDTLMNLVSGLGTSKDKSIHAQFVMNELTKDVLEVMYRSDWVARKIVNAPAQDATRAWRQWQAENADIELIEDAEKHLKIQKKVLRALTLARLYGGSALILGVDAGPAESELIPERVAKDSLKFVHAVSRHELTTLDGLETDLESQYYGEPKMYVRQTVEGEQTRIHPSRVIRFEGEYLPDPAMSSDGWGESVLQGVYEAVRAAGVVSQGVAALVEEAKVDVIKVPELSKQLGTDAATTKLVRRFTLINQAKSLTNALLLDSADEWARVQASFGSLPDVMKVYLLIASGAADIPATRMLGQSPSGLSATGESDIRNYYDRIKSDQVNHLTPNMERLDDVLVRSSTGTDDPDIWYDWNPLWQQNETERADVALKKAQAFQVDVNAMIIPTDALTKGRQNQLIEDGTYPGLETALEESDSEVFNPAMEAQLEQQMAMSEQEHAQGMEAQREGQSGSEKIAKLKGGSKKPQFGKKTSKATDSPAADAQPRTLYVYRKLLNADAVIAWATEQGFRTTVPAEDMHVTVCFSKEPLDWMKVEEDYNVSEDGTLRVPPGGVRLLEMFDGGATVLLFTSRMLTYRHEQIRRAGASSDYDEYQPHVTITYQRGDVDPALVEPYQGELLFGPEVFEPVDLESMYEPGAEVAAS